MLLAAHTGVHPMPEPIQEQRARLPDAGRGPGYQHGFHNRSMTAVRPPGNQQPAWIVMHDVFRYPFPEIARIVGRTPAACRQLASSARRRIRTSQAPATPAALQAGIVADFKRAWEAKDIGALIGLLDPGATATGDGGGLVTAVLRPIEGAEQIARFFAGRTGTAAALTLLERTVNGQPGLVAQLDGATVAVYAFDVAGGRIRHIWAVLNPDKLRPWAAG